MKLLVLGAGGIGGYFGGRLADAGADVTFVVRPGRREQLERDGLRIQSQLGNLQLPVKTVLAEELGPGYDLVLLTCKAYDLDSAMDAIAPAMTGTCAVVPMLNGIAHLERLDHRFGPASVMGGACMIFAALGSDGVIHHTDTLQRLLFGERDRTRSARAELLATVLAKTTINWELSEDIERDMWEKIAFLSGLAATTCLFRANVGEIMAAPGGREAVERALRASVEIVTREGHPPRPAVIEAARARFIDPAGPSSASMLHDMETGHPVESDQIVGWMLEKARKHGVDDTILSLAFTHLRAYEARREAGRLRIIA
ncbi:MAG TPA: ketopantoate reductase family protein [Gemmatimonadaceae bacterium]|nr:ketopantoate reductase family protein [Gemmatimonadaceae bacterium]